MVFAIGAAASAALDLISSLQPAKSSSSAKAVANPSPFKLSGTASASSSQASVSSAVNGLSPATFSALLAAQDPSQRSVSSSPDPLKNLFAQIDGDGDGKIVKSEFEDKLGAGGANTATADGVFSKLDINGDGSVSLDELSAALKSKTSSHRRHGDSKAGSNPQSVLLAALDGATSTSSANSDGSSSTTLTYADGSTVTLNTPVTASKSSAASKASSSYNLVEQLINKQSQALASSAQQSLSIKV